MDRPTIIITGASQGIGAAAAVIAAKKEARVVLSARNFRSLPARFIRRLTVARKFISNVVGLLE